MGIIVKVEFWGVISQNSGFGGSNAAAFLLPFLRVKKEFRESCCFRLIFVRFFLMTCTFSHFFWLLTFSKQKHAQQTLDEND
jgi:hypothetical protein|tara:strand:+ start:312 stop:557 length:246 start_codon:yes stop_codon:yes gene_type:complete